MSGPDETALGATTSPTTRAEVLIRTGRHEEALRYLATVIAQDPQDAGALALVAAAHLGREDYPSALQAAQAALTAEPRSDWALRLRSMAQHHLGDHEGAVRSARESVRLAPWSWESHAQLSRAATPVPQHAQEAWEAARTATRLAPAEASAHAAMGDVAAARKDRVTAERAYREALRLDPQSVHARNNLGLLQMRTGRMHEATEGFVTVGALDPRESAAAINLRVVVLTWMQRTHLAAWLVWWVLQRFSGAWEDSDGVLLPSAVLSLVGLGVLAWWTATTVGRLHLRARGAVWQVLRASRVATTWFAALVVALVASLVTAWAPTSEVRLYAGAVAGLALLTGCLVSWGPSVQRRFRRRR